VKSLRLGTRGSRLALIQSQSVAGALRARGVEVQVVEVVTEGDLRPVGMSPGEGVFVAALERELARGAIDLAVHSAKDVPLKLHPELAIGAYPERADPRDVLVTRAGGSTLAELAAGSLVGTDSPRRGAFLLHRRPDLVHSPLGGNVDTRLRKLDGGEADALILAAAGLHRLSAVGRVDECLDTRIMTPAPGQGALAIQCRVADGETREILSGLDRPELRLVVETERRVLAATGGTCRSPVGALATVSGGQLRLLAAAAALDGSAHHLVELEGEPLVASGNRLAEAAAGELLRRVALLA
jgi:hydroxymethylbilane synthase